MQIYEYLTSFLSYEKFLIRFSEKKLSNALIK